MKFFLKSGVHILLGSFDLPVLSGRIELFLSIVSKRETLMEKATLMLKKGKIGIDEISEYFPELLESDIQEIEEKVMQLA